MAIYKYLVGKNTDILTNLSFFSVILITTVISGSFAWQHHFVFLFPGFIAANADILRSIKTPGRSPSATFQVKKLILLRGFLLFLSAFLVGYHFPDITHPSTTNPILVSHTLMGGLILFGLLLTQHSTKLYTQS